MSDHGHKGSEGPPATSEVSEVFRAHRFVFALQLDGKERRKILQLVFDKADGSIYVAFPYFQHREGIVSLATHPAGAPSSDVEFKVGGRVATHLVKYTHHASGEALFSQTGKVRSLIRKQSVPLSEVYGHLFTVHIQGLRSFKVADARDDGDRSPNPKRTMLTNNWTGDVPDSYKYVARVYAWEALKADLAPGSRIHPNMRLVGDGRALDAFTCAPPIGLPGDGRVVIVTCEPTARLDRTRQSSLVFLGGFDPYDRVNDLNQPSTFLAFSYPIENAQALAAAIGSVDLTPHPKA